MAGKYGPKTRVEADGRVCTGPCGDFKLWSAFPVCSGARLTGHLSMCKECRKDRYPQRTKEQARVYHLARKYGITVGIYQWLLAQHDGRCWLCGELETWIGPKNISGLPNLLSVDHDHQCSRHPPKRACPHCIRGLLCNRCNRALGVMEPSPVLAARFSDYLSLRPLLPDFADLSRWDVRVANKYGDPVLDLVEGGGA